MQKFVFSLKWIFSCFFKSPRSMKRFLQDTYSWDFLPTCMRKCNFKLLICKNSFSQILHWNLSLSEWIFSCAAKCDLLRNLLSQVWHSKGFSVPSAKWLFFSCCLKYPWSMKDLNPYLWQNFYHKSCNSTFLQLSLAHWYSLVPFCFNFDVQCNWSRKRLALGNVNKLLKISIWNSNEILKDCIQINAVFTK